MMKIFLLIALVIASTHCEFYMNLGKSEFKPNLKSDNSSLPTAN